MATEREIFAEEVIRRARAILAGLEHADSGEAHFQTGELLKLAQEELEGSTAGATSRRPRPTTTLIFRALVARIERAADETGISRGHGASTTNATHAASYASRSS